MLRQGVLADGRRPAPPAAAKETAVPRSEQHKRARRANLRSRCLGCQEEARIVHPDAHNLPLDISPQVFEERLTILERASAGQSDAELAATLHCSVWTVRKSRRIGQRHGRAGRARPIGRPPSGPLGSVLPALGDASLQLRRSHPGWGAATILAELRTDPLWAAHPRPSCARIAGFFKHAKLTFRYNRHAEPAAPAAPTLGTPHDEWELDAQRPVQLAKLGKLGLVTVIDTTRRLKVERYPCSGATNPALETDQLARRRAFLTTGLPRRL
jgi:hypothetical protein